MRSRKPKDINRPKWVTLSFKKSEVITDFRIKLCTPTATFPERGSARAAGLDLSADLRDQAAFIELQPGARASIPTGLCVYCSSDVYLRVAPRSGLARKWGIDVLAGVVDADFRGELEVILLNTDQQTPFRVEHGNRIAQLILERVSMTEPVLSDRLPRSDRGKAGFGSTGSS